MYVKPIRPPDIVADAVARAVAGPRWSGTPAELLAAIEAVALDRERQAGDWPRTVVAFAACLRLRTDALRDHGLRLTVMPAELLIERLQPNPRHEPPLPGRDAARSRPRPSRASTRHVGTASDVVDVGGNMRPARAS